MGLLFYSDHHGQYQLLLKKELHQSDKRNNLAVVLLLAFIMKQIKSSSFIDNGNDIDAISTDIKYQINVLSSFIPDLYSIIEQYSDAPTLLVCTTYDLLLTLTSTMIITFFKQEINDNKKKDLITVIDHPVLDQQHLLLIQDTWVYILKLLSIAKNWQSPNDIITLCGWNELDIFMKTCQSIFMDDSNEVEYQQIAISWYWISNHLQSTQLLSKKRKKTNSIFHLKNKHINDHLSNYLKFLLLALLQKGEWLNVLQNDKDFLEKIEIICKSMLENYPIQKPWQSINQLFIPLIYGVIPTLFGNNYSLFSVMTVTTPIISSICQFPWSDPTYSSLMTIDHETLVKNLVFNCFLSNPQASISTLITTRVEPILTTKDDESLVSFYLEIINGTLSFILTNWEESFDFCESLTHDLLGCVCHSNKCCEIMIQCMPFIHLPTFIRSLMIKLIQVKDNERSSQVTTGLIAKALLVDHWCNDSVILYVDLIRDYLQNHFNTFFEFNAKITKSSSPIDILSIIGPKEKLKMNLNENEKEKELLSWPIQLWSSRANEKSLSTTINLLVDKFYDAPHESIFIRVWQMLTLAMLKHEHLILIVLKKCTQILELQNNIYDQHFFKVAQDNAVIYILILPLLILRIFPEKAYNNVKLTSAVIKKWKDTWPLPMEQIKQTQNSDATTGIYVRLANALLFRYDMTKEMTSFMTVHQLTKDVIYKLFQIQE
ncbi:unnamed protein product [Cunninghamella blakesleeana]